VETTEEEFQQEIEQLRESRAPLSLWKKTGRWWMATGADHLQGQIQETAEGDRGSARAGEDSLVRSAARYG